MGCCSVTCVLHSGSQICAQFDKAFWGGISEAVDGAASIISIRSGRQLGVCAKEDEHHLLGNSWRLLFLLLAQGALTMDGNYSDLKMLVILSR